MEKEQLLWVGTLFVAAVVHKYLFFHDKVQFEQKCLVCIEYMSSGGSFKSQTFLLLLLFYMTCDLLCASDKTTWLVLQVWDLTNVNFATKLSHRGVLWSPTAVKSMVSNTGMVTRKDAGKCTSAKTVVTWPMIQRNTLCILKRAIRIIRQFSGALIKDISSLMGTWWWKQKRTSERLTDTRGDVISPTRLWVVRHCANV